MTTDILDKIRPPAIRIEARQPIPRPWRRWIEHTLARWGQVTVDNFAIRVSHLRTEADRDSARSLLHAIVRCAGIDLVPPLRSSASRR